MAKVFVSYSRKDIEFAKRLTAELQKSELDFWIDWEGIPPTVDWWREIEKGIEEADVFLFLISPDSAKSKVCGKEIDCAVKNGKRLIPLVVRDIKGDETPSQLSHLNWIFFRENDDFDAGLQKLLTGIHTDYEWVKEHRWLQVRALDWERENKDNSSLLRGKDLLDAEQDLAINSSKEPHPTDLQREYVFESRKATDRQRRTTTSIAIGGSVVLAVLAVVAVVMAVRATEQATISRAGELAALANSEEGKHFDLALLFGVEAFRKLNNPHTQSALSSLTDSHPGLEIILSGHKDAVRSVAFSRKHLASKSIDGSIILWDMSNPKVPLQVFTLSAYGPEDIISHSNVTFSPDGNRIAWGGADGTIHLCEVNNPNEIDKLVPQGRNAFYTISNVTFSLDGKYIALAEAGPVTPASKIILWDITDPARPSQIISPISGYGVAFGPDGRNLATGNQEGTITLWDFSNPVNPVRHATSSAEHGREINNIVFNPDGNRIASGSNDGSIMLWDISDQSKPFQLMEPLSDDLLYLSNVAFSPDGKWLAWGGKNDFSVILWNSTDPANPAPIKLFGHSNYVTSVAFSPDGRRIAAGSDDGSIILWDLSNLTPPSQIVTISATTFAFSPDGNRKLIAAGRFDGTISISDMADLTKSSQLGLPSLNPVELLVFSPDAKHIASSYFDGSTLLWDVNNPASFSQLDIPSDNVINSLVFSPDGKYITSGKADGTVTLWDISNWASPSPLTKIPGHKSAIVSLAFSTDAKQLASGSSDGSIILSDVSDPANPHQLAKLAGSLNATDKLTIQQTGFTMDGKRIAVYSDGLLTLSDVNHPANLAQFATPFRSIVESLVFSRDGDLLASGSNNGTIILWDTSNPASPTFLAQISGIKSGIYSLAFSEDRKRLAFGSTGNISLLEITNPTAPFTLASFSSNPDLTYTIVGFNRDGKILASGSYDDTLILWDLDPESWAAKACQRAGRNFTRAEWAQYFPNEDYRKTCEQWD